LPSSSHSSMPVLQEVTTRAEMRKVAAASAVVIAREYRTTSPGPAFLREWHAPILPCRCHGCQEYQISRRSLIWVFVLPEFVFHANAITRGRATFLLCSLVARRTCPKTRGPSIEWSRAPRAVFFKVLPPAGLGMSFLTIRGSSGNLQPMLPDPTELL